MFQELRWRIAAYFVFLSTIAFAVLVAIAFSLFYHGLTRYIDDDLQALAVRVMPGIDVRGEIPVVDEDFPENTATKRLVLATVQLYDRNGRFLAEHGRPGIRQLAIKTKELVNETDEVRCLTQPLKDKGVLKGYLQLEVTTRIRHAAVKQFVSVMGFIAPILLALLGVLGYVFELITTRPLEHTFVTLQSFVADAGHELKTPVSVMEATLENVLRKRADDEWMMKRVEVLSRSLERMSRLVQDLIILSDIESKSLIHQGQPVRLDECVRDVVEEMDDLFKAKPVALTVEKLEPCSVLGDSYSIVRVITNLLSNALRYTEPGGSVSVSLIQVGKELQLSIKDTGVGIPPQSLKKIFDRFYRVDKSRSRQLGGSGLGLAIVKAIVTAHCGTVDVKSEVGKGSEFTVVLPVSGSV